MLKRLLTLACLLASFPTFPASQPDMIVVCYPGGSVNADEANAAMGAMLRVVERIGQWRENSFASVFATKTDECRKQMAKNSPKFAIISLGLFLELRGQNHLIPLIQPKIKGRTSETYRVMVEQGKFNSLEELKGKTLGGTVWEEPDFIGRIVFAGQYDPANFFVLKPSNQAIRALRSLAKGELAAVMLNQQQFDGLASLHLAKPLTAVFTSEEIPLMGVVADAKAATEEERGRFAKALEGMCADLEGKKLCQLFGIDAFAAVDAAVFEPFIKRWTGGK